MDRRKLQGLITALLLLCSATGQTELYQWTDENGRVHFGDRAPDSHPEDTIKRFEAAPAAPEREAISLQIKASEFELSDAGMAQIQTLIPQVFYLYRSLFGLDMRRTAEVKLYLLKDKPTFDAWMTERNGRDESLPYVGVYMTKSREVAVWQFSENEQEVIDTILHESSHVIMGQLSPYAPSWLQEAMAEYFENMRAEGNDVVIHPAAYHLARLDTWRAKGELITLRSYLGMPERQWRGMAHNSNPIPYTVAWATGYFMLSNDTGKRVLRRLLQDLEKSQRWPTAEDIDQAYPGGLSRMDYEFFKWLQAGVTPHRYPMQR